MTKPELGHENAKKLADGEKLNAEELADFNRLKGQLSKIGKTLIESPEVSKVLDKMGAGQRAQVDKILDDLAHGRPGRNQHALTGDLKGKFAVDVPGSGRGRGALRIVYEDTLDGIVLHFITDYH